MTTSVVAALRLLGSSKAGTPLETASTPVSAVHPEANARSTRNTPGRRRSRRHREAVVGTLGRDAGAERDLPEPDGEQQVNRCHETVGRQSERPAGLLDAAQVRERQDGDEAERQPNRMRSERGHRARDRRHAGDHRNRNGQHVVDQQRRRRHQRGILAEVRAAGGSGSEQNTGSASRFGSSVSCRRSLRNGFPTNVRARAAADELMHRF